MPIERAASIFHAGDELADQKFARRVANAIAAFCVPSLVDVNELERMDEAADERSERFFGVPIIVLSDAMLGTEELRKKVVAVTPTRNAPGVCVFYICRGITAEKVREKYPDLEPLFLDVMVGDEEHLPELVSELKDYLQRVPERGGLGRRARLTARLAGAIFGVLLGPLARFVYVGAFFSSALLLRSLLLTGGDPFWDKLYGSHVLFALGYGFSRVEPLDLWPSLGPAWAIGDRAPGAHKDSGRSHESFLEAIGPWQATADAARSRKLTALTCLAVPGLAAFADHGQQLAFAAFAAGILVPRVHSWAHGFLVRKAARSQGLTPEDMERTTAHYSAFGARRASKAQYSLLGGTAGERIHRPWFAARPQVFISYAWRDKEWTSAAQDLERTLNALRVPCFLDDRQIPGKFSAWRGSLVEGILECTHFFVVLGPTVQAANVMHREIRTALQRWHTELEPTVVCIAQPEVLEALSRENVSAELQYLFENAPKLSHAEASRPAIVARLLRQRRRPGLWRDWLTLLRPDAELERFMSSQSVDLRG